MTKAELLAKVKSRQGNIPDHLDETIEGYIDDSIDYLLSAGVPSAYLDLANDNINPKCIGVINRGVADLWNYGNDGGKFTPYFYERADQLRHEVISNE